VIHPVFVDHTKRHHALKLPHDGRAVLRFLFLIGLAEHVGNAVCHLRGVHGLQLFVGRDPRAFGEADILKVAHEREERLPVLEMRLARKGVCDIALDVILHHGGDALLKVFSVEHLPALLVDDLALGVHHVVVFKDALTRLIVAAFDRLLGVFDRAGEDLCVDRGVLVDAERLHHAHDALGAEQTHDVVLQRQIELRFAGVSLTAGAAAQLIINPARLVALGADDEKAACVSHELCLLVNLHLIFGVGLLIRSSCGENFGVVRFGKGVGFGDEFVGKALLFEVALGHELRVAAEHDIRAAACHVGRDCDRAEMTGLRDDFGFLFVVLGVQNVMRDTFTL